MSTKTIRKRGRVQAFNVSPKGSYEGLLLEGKSKAEQVNGISMEKKPKPKKHAKH